MNKTQTAIVLLAILELILCCFFIPQLMFRMQDSNLAQLVQDEQVEYTTLSTYDNSIYSQSSALTFEEKVDLANSYDSTVTTIYLEKGEKYTANQICSIAAGELDAICQAYENSSLLFQRIASMTISSQVREYGSVLEMSASEDDGDIGYADVETVDEFDIVLEPYTNEGISETRLEPCMYINSAEPEQAFIVWDFSYYDIEDGTTLFMMFDDESGRLLSVTGSLANFNDKANYSLYSDTKETIQLIKNYYNEIEESEE